MARTKLVSGDRMVGKWLENTDSLQEHQQKVVEAAGIEPIPTLCASLREHRFYPHKQRVKLRSAQSSPAECFAAFTHLRADYLLGLLGIGDGG